MDMNFSNCYVCLTTQPLSLIDIFADQHNNQTIASVITQHFWFEIKEEDGNKYICGICWAKVHNFHSFYIQVCNIHTEFYSKVHEIIKVEIEDENSNRNETHNNETLQNVDAIEKLEKNTRNCRLCLTTESNLVNIFDQRGSNQNIPAILSNHFWFQVNVEDIEKYICHLCWAQVEDFHMFYMQVQTIHSAIIKVEIESDSGIYSNSDLPNEISNDGTSHNIECSFETCFDETINDIERTIKTNKSKKILDTIEQDKLDRQNNQIKEYFSMDCELCPTRCETFQIIQTHYRTEHKIRGYVRCCKRKFTESTTVMDHIQLHLNPDTFKCPICNKRYAHKKGLRDHQVRHLPTEEKPFKCTECPKNFTKRFILNIHLATHKNEKNFECDVCGKLFRTKPLLKAHTKNVHDGLSVHVCHACAKEFPCKSVFEHHQMTVHHIVLSKVRCQTCGIWLKNAYQLRQHCIVRHELSKVDHSCHICGKRYLNRKALLSHIKHVHNDKVYKCDICEKIYKKPISLKEHMATHTGDKLYTCPYCPKKFNSSANMYSHKKKTHVKEREEHERLKAAGAV